MAPLNVTQFFDGLVTIVDPAAFSDTSAKIRASVVGSVIAATGMPCCNACCLRRLLLMHACMHQRASCLATCLGQHWPLDTTLWRLAQRGSIVYPVSPALLVKDLR